MGLFDKLKKSMDRNETDVERQSRERREAAAKGAADKRKAAEAEAEKRRQKTKGYKSDREENMGSFRELFFKKKKP